MVVGSNASFNINDSCSLYFNSKLLGSPRRSFVIWVDCMGTQCFISRSIDISANVVMKFQTAVAWACSSFDDVCVYPVMDGAYITSESFSSLKKAIGLMMGALFRSFIKTEEQEHRYLVRGAIAYGDVFHGADISKDAFDRKVCDDIGKRSIMLGLPMIQAYQCERCAPPFGISIHESCKLSDCAHSFPVEWYDWTEALGNDDFKLFRRVVDDYFEFYRNQTFYSGYSEEKINDHKQRFEQYMKMCESRRNNACRSADWIM